MVSVTTSSSSCDLVKLSIAAPDSTGCVQYATTLVAPCAFSAAAAAHRVPAVSTMSSTSTQILPLDVADDVHHRGDVRARAALVDDRQVRVVEALGDRPRAHHAADVRRHHDQVVRAVRAPDVGEQQRRGIDVVDRDVEEALDLVGVQVDRQHAVGADRS